MNNSAQLRPELLLGPNPFLEALPPPLTFTALPKALQYSAFSDLPVWGLEPSLRESLIETVDTHFVATSTILEPACGLQLLVRRALGLRNPLNQHERNRVNRIGASDNKLGIRHLATMDGAGMWLAGMTATGKSALIRRMLSLIAPEQVLDFGSSEACGWYKLRQCVYLLVDHPSNGSRGGLLKRILLQLDHSLQTDYFEQHKRTANLDSLLVVVCKLLTVHRVGMLVVDEKQESTFADSPWSLEFVLFYLTLMNLGISVVLAGNPLAFGHLRSLSQVMRRFSTGGIHELVPATASDRWWARDFVFNARKANLVEHWDIGEAERSALELQHSGGLPGLYMALHKEVMRQALRRGGKEARVTTKDFSAAVVSPRYVEAKRIALSISEANFQNCADYTDIPTLHDKRPAGDTKHYPPAAILPEVEYSRVTRLLTNFKTAQTKILNNESRRLKAFQTLDPESARMLGISIDLIESMKGIRQPSDSKIKKGRQPGRPDAENVAP